MLILLLIKQVTLWKANLQACSILAVSLKVTDAEVIAQSTISMRQEQVTPQRSAAKQHQKLSKCPPYQMKSLQHY